MSNVNWVTFTIVLALFCVVTLVGFAAARWRRAENMMHLHEWGLGGRNFGTFIAWFLLGGDLYTAYTFIAVPAAVFGAGAVTGFFAVSYTIIVFPIALIFLPRLWSIARTHSYVTSADFIRGVPKTFSINLQLLGGIWILQVFPPIVFGLFTRWFHRWALLGGWLAGMIFGTIAAYKVATPTTSHWAGSVDIEFGHTVYIGLSAIILNIAVAVILTLVFKAARVPEGADETLPHQYTADPAEAPARAPATVGLGAAGAAGD